MSLSNFRTRSIFQEWDFLIGVAQDGDLPEDVRQDAAWLVKHHPYSQKIHLNVPVRPEWGDEEQQRGYDDDPLLDAMPPVWMMLDRRRE
ncbi:hypothetical protein ID144_21800 [Pseudomonas sp. JM0905a]|uniref:hypothetical protein n=1 Tax=Pseudomonas sp. JM0905a TaxID=2772484 RepID=UPI00168934F8|nr:hypothetical protein [Pseudomonas sp. JM0905a]MBD2839682.1 hypothetical protein [Pseudomonas sp. JM0905a]